MNDILMLQHDNDGICLLRRLDVKVRANSWGFKSLRSHQKLFKYMDFPNDITKKNSAAVNNFGAQ